MTSSGIKVGLGNDNFEVSLSFCFVGKMSLIVCLGVMEILRLASLSFACSIRFFNAKMSLNFAFPKRKFKSKFEIFKEIIV